MRSKVPAAEKFEEWVVGEVLPCIRQTGAYMTRDQVENFICPDTTKQMKWTEKGQRFIYDMWQKHQAKAV